MKFFLFILGMLFTLNTFAQKVKIATLVPKGTSWAKTLSDMSKEIKEKTEGKVKFKIYFGGIQGDEIDVLRKSRIGQLHGGVFTGKTLGDISPDMRSVEVPFNFYHDEKKARKFLKESTPSFNKDIDKENFVNLGFYGIGKVYLVSSKEVKSISELKGIKMWAWDGDKVVQAMVDSLELVSVPLALPDVMSSLSTGIIDAAYAPPLGILALQWQNKVKFLVDFPIAYSIGALLISKKKWKKIKPEYQIQIKEIAKKHIARANEFAVKDNEDSLVKLKEMGIKFTKFSKSDLDQAEQIRLNVLKRLRGKILSEKVINKLEEAR